MAFETKEEIYKAMEMMADKIRQDQPLYEKLASANLICQMNFSNIDSACVTVMAKNNMLNFEFGESSIKPDATVSGSDDMFVKFWQGKVNLMMAMAKGQIKIGGAVASITKLLPRLKGCYPKWKDVLKEIGRPDLIAK